LKSAAGHVIDGFLIFASRRVEHITRTFAEIAPDEYDAARIDDVAASLPH
jgi:hypothetical protein